ncbi:WD40-repeat-containing domain protein [Chytridium lagenaria]|nr:WD40-repeat-containing domain protein [Chytridium lagenaria]
MHAKNEVVRLITQALNDLGYKNAASTLEKDSGITLESESVGRFRQALLGGEWESAEKLMLSLDIPKNSLKTMSFLIRQQKYLELLESKQYKVALRVLRKEVSPTCPSPLMLHALSSLLMCVSSEDLHRYSQWDGAGGKSREDLLLFLQTFISAKCMIPEKRLQTLLDQAIQLQVSNCLYHNVHNEDVSLYVDHSCDRLLTSFYRSHFPCKTLHVLGEHSDEVWLLSFSNDGNYLASASKDSTAIIWSADDFSAVQYLLGHNDGISFLSWSPDDTWLLTGSNDKSLKIWNVKDGTCGHTFTRPHQEAITSCAWLPEGNKFVAGSADKSIVLWNIHGDVLFKWNVRATDLSVSLDGKSLYVISERRIRIFSLATKEEIDCIEESKSITSLHTAKDMRHILVNVLEVWFLSIYAVYSYKQEIHLWNVDEKELVRKYTGHKQERFVIRSCFGGMHQNFVLTGSEDAKIYVWHREQGTLLEVLEGHIGCVNGISWNAQRNIFASASDDHSIRIWGAA